MSLLIDSVHFFSHIVVQSQHEDRIILSLFIMYQCCCVLLQILMLHSNIMQSYNQHCVTVIELLGCLMLFDLN